MKENNGWKKFEDNACKIIRTLNPKAGIYQNVYLDGKLSEVKRQIDVQLVEPDKYDHIIFECKDYKRVLDVSIIEKFNTKLQDVQAKNGAIVANSHFSQAAQNMASKLNIDLLNLVDTSNQKVKTKLYAGVLLSDISVKRFTIKLGSLSYNNFLFSTDPSEIKFVNKNNNTITVPEAFAQLWNQDKDLSNIPGLYEYTPRNENQRILGLDGEIIALNKLSFIYEVIKKYYFDNIEIIEAQGLYNVKKRSFQTRNITTQEIVPSKIEKEGKEISENDIPKLKNKLTFGLEVRSVYPEKLSN